MIKKLLVLLILLLVVDSIYSQVQSGDSSITNQLYVVTKFDGTQYIGKILSDDGREMLMDTEALGKIYIPKADIRSITKLEDDTKLMNGEFSAEGPFTTRYAFTTNALPIVKGENYGLINLYGPEVHFAVTNHFNIGIMSTWIASPMLLALKYSFKTKNEKVNLSLGTLGGTSGYLNNFRGYGGIHFANITFGSRAKNITFSGGYAYVKTGGTRYEANVGVYVISEPPSYAVDIPIIQGPIFSVAGIVKVGARASFVFDSMIGYFSQDGKVTTLEDATPSDLNDYNWIRTVSKVTRTSTALFVMPGMRFQKTDKQAFQISLAGVSVFRHSGYATSTQKSSSFPFPMFTWFFKF